MLWIGEVVILIVAVRFFRHSVFVYRTWLPVLSRSAIASLTLQAWHAVARNLACRWGKKSCQCAWGCAGKRVRWNGCHVVARIFPRCHELSRRNCRATFVSFREQFVNYEQTRCNWVTRRANACRDVNILKFSQRGLAHTIRIPTHPTHTVTSSSVIGTFVVPLWLVRLASC